MEETMLQKVNHYSYNQAHFLTFQIQRVQNTKAGVAETNLTNYHPTTIKTTTAKNPKKQTKTKTPRQPKCRKFVSQTQDF